LISLQAAKIKLWTTYLWVHGHNLTLLRYPQCTRLVQVGLPNRLRGEMWETFCGYLYVRFVNHGIYQRILKKNKGKTRICIVVWLSVRIIRSETQLGCSGGVAGVFIWEFGVGLLSGHEYSYSHYFNASFLFIFCYEIGNDYLRAICRFMTNAFKYNDSLLPQHEANEVWSINYITPN